MSLIDYHPVVFEEIFKGRLNMQLRQQSTLWTINCQAQVQIQDPVQVHSWSIPGPFQVYFKSFQSIPIQNQMIWTRSWYYFHYFHYATTYNPPPANFSGDNEDPKQIQIDF